MKTQYEFSNGERGRFFRESAKLRIPASEDKLGWTAPTGKLGKFVFQEAQRSLNAYREQPKLITEHARSELDTAQGGYANRQLFELVQNSADALLESPNGKSVLVRLTERFLYCADDGDTIDEDGIEGLMFDRMSSKRNTGAIGRFGRGFKSVLGVTDGPEFYSRSGSFRFNKERAAERIAKVASAERYPVLRLPEPIDPCEERDKDEELQELMGWATNIVRLPLKTGAHGDLVQQVRNFPPEFLLFVDHVRYLTLEDGKGSRAFMLHRQDGELRLDTGNGYARWRRFDITHRLSAIARADWHLHDDGDDVPVSWAAPLDRLDRPGHFWAFFPTDTASLVAGILNAPWKTNEDRQNLLPGPYNGELIEAAAGMIAETLPQLATNDDPARHLDALPRRHEGGDSKQVDLLRERLFSGLDGREVVPDQVGKLRVIRDISYPPKKLTDGSDTAPFERWAEYADRPRDWLHHNAVTRNRLSRLAAINRLFPPRWDGDDRQSALQASIAEWLEALVNGKEGDEAIQASMAAIQAAAAIPSEKRSAGSLGNIVLTLNGSWRTPDPERIFLPDVLLDEDGAKGRETYVHPDLASDNETLSALKTLGLKLPSPESSFRLAARRILESDGDRESNDELHREFWIASRKLSPEAATAVIQEHRHWPKKLRMRTRSGSWRLPCAVLLPGEIVPGDESRDDDATVDTEFHERDDKLLRGLGVTETLSGGSDLSAEPWFGEFLDHWRERFTSRPLEKNPHLHLLNFKTSIGNGPLEVLRGLSDDGRQRYTDALLASGATYLPWTMQHDTSDIYPPLMCEPPAVMVLRKHGRIRTLAGIVPLAEALGPSPKNPEALHALLAHPMADEITAAFDLAEPTPEFFGEGDPVPLIDVWPGLREHLPPHRKQCRLVSCERILVVGQDRPCVFRTPDVFLVGTIDDDEEGTLRLIADELGLALSPGKIEAILQRKTPSEIEERRAAVQNCSTDAERLLAAVGEEELRSGLPSALLAVLENDGTTLAGTEIAEASIATYHTDALRQYKGALDRLDPPSQWAGSAPAVDFVRSLGFSADWAGEPQRKRTPFLEVAGPYSLPPLHDYQQTIVENVRKMLRNQHGESAEHRGMISLPTGSGKTRVAVQALVEAIRGDGFTGGILWVADRDELCEQAVEAWRQVWSSIGPEAVQLRISRMWGGQPRPLPTTDLHVIVATIQTLNAKLSNQICEYKFLANFRLVVFDEAHRSLAPTFTSAMQEIGLTRFQSTEEPFLIGLTATPYRGHDEEESRWLVNRYGRKRLDSGAFAEDDTQAVIRELQNMRVLAHIDHATIDGGTFQLDASDLEKMSKFGRASTVSERLLAWLPQSAEDRIAHDVERTERIVAAYEMRIHSDWPVLIFATSVEHAQTVAALLNRKGIRSRAVSGQTETACRRRMVEEFRRGEVRALVNYGVFREGFDAPKTRAIIVARPVYSPNLYFQMIGRGLRGPKNGGDDRCLILNVRDNIENFDRELAFSELDWLWT